MNNPPKLNTDCMVDVSLDSDEEKEEELTYSSAKKECIGYVLFVSIFIILDLVLSIVMTALYWNDGCMFVPILDKWFIISVAIVIISTIIFSTSMLSLNRFTKLVSMSCHVSLLVFVQLAGLICIAFAYECSGSSLWFVFTAKILIYVILIFASLRKACCDRA